MAHKTRISNLITEGIEHTKGYDRNISDIIYEYARPGEADVAYVKGWNKIVWHWTILFEISRMNRTRKALLKLDFIPIEYSEESIELRRNKLLRICNIDPLPEINDRKMKYYYKCWKDAFNHYQNHKLILEEWLGDILLAEYCEDLQINIYLDDMDYICRP